LTSRPPVPAGRDSGQVTAIPLESALWYNKGVDLLTVSVTARESAGEPYTLVEVAGEADVTNTDDLRRLLDDEVSQQPRMMIIDLSGLRFMDSSALHTLLRASRSMDRQGGVLALVSPQPAVAKILRLTTADRLIPVFDTVADAAAG
jgi:anti-sigma B factor antagonist